MISPIGWAMACTKCRSVFVGEGKACPRCKAFDKLLGVADSLVKWHGTVDVVSGSAAADQLRSISDQAAIAAAEARAL